MENPNLEWMIWGYPYFRKPPYLCVCAIIFMEYSQLHISDLPSPNELITAANQLFNKCSYKLSSGNQTWLAGKSIIDRWCSH